MEAVGVTDPARCVFVGDRLFDDIWGADQVGMRTIHVPHSEIPVEQHGHTEGEPDAVVHELGELLAIVEAWHRGGPTARAADRACPGCCTSTARPGSARARSRGGTSRSGPVS